LIPDPGSVRRILVRANNWIGDVVMISPAIRALRERFSGAEIAILAKPWVLDALSGNPYFDRLLPYEVPGRHGGPLGRIRLAAELRREKFDIAVLFQKAFEAAFLAAAARIPTRIGYDTDRRGLLLTDPIPWRPECELKHHVDVFLELAIACGCTPASSEPFFYLADQDRAWAEAYLEEAGSPPEAELFAIHAGASKPPRAWHMARFAELARILRAEQGLVPLVLGDGSDAEAARAIAAAVPGTIVAAGATSVRQMAALLARARIFAGNDSGPMHIAAALGVPGVAIFGPGLPEKTAPRSARAPFEAVTVRAACSPCRQNFFRECEAAPSGKPWCLERIEVADVAAACRRVLGASARA